jgi:hypothetical protein
MNFGSSSQPNDPLPAAMQLQNQNTPSSGSRPPKKDSEDLLGLF